MPHTPSARRIGAVFTSLTRRLIPHAHTRRVALRIAILAAMSGVAACATGAPQSRSTPAAPHAAASPSPAARAEHQTQAAASATPGCASTPSPSAATVAVADFEGGSIPPDNRTEFWGRALATFMIADLACANNLRPVDRAHLAAVLREQRLSASDLSDPATRIRIGKILGARYFVFGTYTIVGGQAALTARIDSVETSQIIEAKSASGSADQMRELSQKLAADFLGSLNQSAVFRNTAPASKAGTPAAGAVAYFDQGLTDERQGNYGRAIDEYAHALALDPNYRQARERLEKASESAARQ